MSHSIITQHSNDVIVTKYSIATKVLSLWEKLVGVCTLIMPKIAVVLFIEISTINSNISVM